MASLDPQQDAQLYISTVKLFVSSTGTQLADQIKLVKVATSNSKPYYNTAHNLLNVLLVNTYPGTVPYSSIYNIAEKILDEPETADDVFVEGTLDIPNETSLIATANDLLHDINSTAQFLNFLHTST